MRRILVIDDEAPLRNLLTSMLGREGFVVETAEDGAAGVAAFRRRRPDLVITDILMPNKGGLVAIREILDLDPAMKIVAMSGGGRTGKLNFLSTARTFPGVQTLQKPFRQAELMAAVRGALGSE
ncbi:MAG: response regulator [Deferrisomatales bacterium]|nr:response regulator [Deferrisomatales bacterium]